MKKILFVISIVFYFVICTSIVSAANASFDKKAKSGIKVGTEITEGNINIALSGNELNHFKDSITIKLKGAEWINMEESGDFNSVIGYQKIDSNTLKLKINVNEDMIKNGYTLKIPVNCKVVKVYDNISATIDYGYSDISKSLISLATGNVTKASVDYVRNVNTGDRFYLKNNDSTYSKLMVFVTKEDAEKVAKSSIHIDFDGIRLTDYKENGSLYCDKGDYARFIKSADSRALDISFNGFNNNMRTDGFYIKVPLTGEITGTDEIKATISFGCDVDPIEIICARVDNGTVTVQSENPDAPIELANTVSNVIINDSTIKAYTANTKINVQLNQVFSFQRTPKIEATGKFKGKCKIELNPNDKQKAVITIVQNINAGETGTIKISNVILERSKNATNKFNTVEMSFTSSSWKDTVLTAVVAKYQEGANTTPPFAIGVNSIRDAKKYSALDTITIKDQNRLYSANTKIMLSFDNGFRVFKNGYNPTVTGSGCFENNCKFVMEDEQAYVLIPKGITDDKFGSIAINDLIIERDSEDSFEGYVKITAVIENDGTSSMNAAVAKYSSIYDTVPQTTTAAESTTETTTADANIESGSEVKFVIGDKNYSINGKISQLLATPYIKDGYTMLPMRVIANIVGISNDNIVFADGTAVFKLADGKEIKVTAGSNKYIINGQNADISTSAEIVNGTMFLPMRDLANAIGISNDDISYDAARKEISLNIR